MPYSSLSSNGSSLIDFLRSFFKSSFISSLILVFNFLCFFIFFMSLAMSSSSSISELSSSSLNLFLKDNYLNYLMTGLFLSRTGNSVSPSWALRISSIILSSSSIFSFIPLTHTINHKITIQSIKKYHGVSGSTALKTQLIKI